MTIALVQSVALAGGGQAILTLPGAPTAGNMLLFLGSHYSWAADMTIEPGWARILDGTSSGYDVLCAYVKTAGVGESTTQQPFADDNPRGFSGTIFEISGADSIPVITALNEASESTLTLTKASSAGPSALLGIFSTTSSNELPTITGDATTQQTAQGTSSAVSPRAITAVFAGESTAALSSTATWTGTLDTYGLLAVLNQPGIITPRVATYVVEGQQLFLDAARAATYVIEGRILYLNTPRVAAYVVEGPPSSSNHSQAMLGTF